MKATESISALRTQLAERKIVRQRSRQLEAELASYRTPAERLEFEAILSRHTSEEIEELEAMLRRPAAVIPAHL
jgi:hypothetical protein